MVALTMARGVAATEALESEFAAGRLRSMNIFARLFGREQKSESISLDTLIRRLEIVYETVSGITVTPDTAMASPTVHAIVTAVSRCIAALPFRVMRKTEVGGRARKEHLPSHPV
jgi:phage portal protein BeeE